MPGQIENVTFYNVDEAAKVLACHFNTVLNYLNSGTLTGAKTIGGEWILSKQELTRYLHAQGLRNDVIQDRFHRLTKANVVAAN